jgi:hypothetical protein
MALRACRYAGTQRQTAFLRMGKNRAATISACIFALVPAKGTSFQSQRRKEARLDDYVLGKPVCPMHCDSRNNVASCKPGSIFSHSLLFLLALPFSGAKQNIAQFSLP